jgi:putative transposase
VKSYKYRLYPTKAQVTTLEETLKLCCELYNAALQERRDVWAVCKNHPNFYDAEWRAEHAKDYRINYNMQSASIAEIKHTIRPEYEQIGAHVLQNVLKRVDKAYQDFFSRVKNDKAPGYPRFRSVKRYDSFCFPDTKGLKLSAKHITLSKIGTIKVKLHREIGGIIKTATVKREGQYWYVVFVCESAPVVRLPYTDDCVGVDLGVSNLATMSSGDVIANPKHYRNAEAKLEIAQQSLSRKKPRSHRHRKAVQRVARLHRKVANQRKDYLNKHSRWLVDTYETIIFEDIKPANMSKRAKPKQDEETGQYLPNNASAKSGLNKSILDAGWNMFIAMCVYKAEDAGRLMGVVKVSPKYTSQICSSCGTVKKKELSERWHRCECGCELDRDVNAAINIRNLWLGRSH